MLPFLSGWLNKVALEPSSVNDSSKALVSSLFMMAWFFEARDPHTGGHLWRVSRYARLLGEEAGLPSADVARASLGGFLHDLGKIGIPDAVLRKTSALNADEFAIVRTHPEMGWRMLSGHPLADWVKDAVYSHHERPDGTGYPRGLHAEEIHQDARIVGICDAFDAMTSSRPYTLLMVTHNLAQARRLADHVAVCWVRDGCGCVLDSGPACELFESARDPLAHRYLNGLLC